MERGCVFILIDPHEVNNLAAAMPWRLRQLKDRYDELRAERLDQSDALYWAVTCGHGPAAAVASGNWQCIEWSDAYLAMLKRNR